MRIFTLRSNFQIKKIAKIDSQFKDAHLKFGQPCRRLKKFKDDN